MKRYQRRKLGRVAIQVLEGLLAGGFIVAAFAVPNIAQVAKLFKANSKYERLKVKRSIESLEKHGLIAVKPSKNYFESHIRLTRAGNELLELEGLVLPKEKRWDGRWRIIAFDVPEPYKKARQALSIKLRELGCYHYQNSVFVYPYDCREEITFIKDYFGLDGSIKYITATDLDDQTKLEDYFKL